MNKHQNDFINFRKLSIDFDNKSMSYENIFGIQMPSLLHPINDNCYIIYYVLHQCHHITRSKSQKVIKKLWKLLIN